MTHLAHAVNQRQHRCAQERPEVGADSESRVKSQESRVKSQESRVKSQESRVKSGEESQNRVDHGVKSILKGGPIRLIS